MITEKNRAAARRVLGVDEAEFQRGHTANEITAALLIEIPKRFTGARVWRNNRVDAMVPGRGGKPRRVQAGINGQADITGIFPTVRPVSYDEVIGICPPKKNYIGLRLEIEVKAGNDVMSYQQKAFRLMIEGAGGIYIEARSVEQCLEELGRWE